MQRSSGSSSEQGHKVHVIPITVEGRDDVSSGGHSSNSRPSSTEPFIRNAPFARTTSPQQAAHQIYEKPIRQTSPTQTQPQRVHQIPIHVEHSTDSQSQETQRPQSQWLPRSEQQPRPSPFSDSHIPNLAKSEFVCKNSGQGQSSSRTHSASFSDLPARSNTAANTSPPKNPEGPSKRSSGAPSGPRPKKPAEQPPEKKIEEIMNEAKNLEKEVDQFNGSVDDKQYRYLDEYLTRALLKLDQIETQGDAEIRQLRKNAITYVESVISKLESQGKKMIEEVTAEVEEQKEKSEEENVKTDEVHMAAIEEPTEARPQ